MSNLNIEQLKEFFDFRAKEHDKRIEKVENTVEDISKNVSSFAVKINTMWKVIGAVVMAIILTLVKHFMTDGL
jgi:archaellum component FlaC